MYLKAGANISRRMVSSYVWRVRRGFVFQLDPGRDNSQGHKPALNATLRCLDVDEVRQLCSWAEMREAEVARRATAGDTCVGVLVDDAVVAISWLHSGACYVRGVDLWLQGRNTDWYCYGIVTRPDRRGQGIYRYLLQSLTDYARERAATAIVQYVEAFNTVPRKVLPALGYETIQVSSRRFAGVRHASVYRVQERIHVERLLLCQPSDVYWI